MNSPYVPVRLTHGYGKVPPGGRCVGLRESPMVWRVEVDARNGRWERFNVSEVEPITDDVLVLPDLDKLKQMKNHADGFAVMPLCRASEVEQIARCIALVEHLSAVPAPPNARHVALPAHGLDLNLSTDEHGAAVVTIRVDPKDRHA